MKNGQYGQGPHQASRRRNDTCGLEHRGHSQEQKSRERGTDASCFDFIEGRRPVYSISAQQRHHSTWRRWLVFAACSVAATVLAMPVAARDGCPDGQAPAFDGSITSCCTRHRLPPRLGQCCHALHAACVSEVCLQPGGRQPRRREHHAVRRHRGTQHGLQSVHVQRDHLQQ